MRNHWLKLYEQKKRRFWTAEFSKNGVFVLKARRIGITAPEMNLGYMGSTSGRVEIIFKSGMTSNDKELVDFLIESRKGMKGWFSRLRFYASLMSELEYYELSDLGYGGIGTGKTIEDIAMEFDYNGLKHVHCV